MKVSGIRVIREAVGKDNDKLVPFNTFNKGTDLLTKAEGSFQRPGFGSFPKISKDGKMAMVEIVGDGVPVAGATAIKAAGTLVVQTASKKEAVKSAAFDLKKAVKGKVILQFELWTDLAEKKIPFSITAGVGG